ncbi:MAG: hypothetical protein HY344_01460 [Candidatus Levybacteria bacterium]|nr:hypothetical protein [Candidatus Levybacteria bacterium]
MASVVELLGNTPYFLSRERYSIFDLLLEGTPKPQRKPSRRERGRMLAVKALESLRDEGTFFARPNQIVTRMNEINPPRHFWDRYRTLNPLSGLIRDGLVRRRLSQDRGSDGIMRETPAYYLVIMEPTPQRQPLHR